VPSEQEFLENSKVALRRPCGARTWLLLRIAKRGSVLAIAFVLFKPANSCIVDEAATTTVSAHTRGPKASERRSLRDTLDAYRLGWGKADRNESPRAARVRNFRNSGGLLFGTAITALI
jgi:hypothetical protein